ncbi:MAG: carboxypeptidase-like regulatory domain-containing protein, partial [Gemmatimonadaceae bacterium]
MPLLLCIFPPVTARAQIGATTDIITGVVKDEAGTPVDGATVEVTSIETTVTRKARTNAQGKYTVLFPDGGGQYRVTVRLLGKAPTVLQVQRQADEDRLLANAVLKQAITQIAGVTIAARQAPAQNAFERPTPGSTERALNSDQAARLPIDGSDLQQLALTAPGVVSISGSDSTGASFSVAGMRPDAN